MSSLTKKEMHNEVRKLRIAKIDKDIIQIKNLVQNTGDFEVKNLLSKLVDDMRDINQRTANSIARDSK